MADTGDLTSLRKNDIISVYQLKEKLMDILVCKECGQERKIGRRLCSKCNTNRVAKYGRYTWTKKCNACGDEYKAWRKTQKLCIKCHEDCSKLQNGRKATNNYIFQNGTSKHKHRFIAESLIGRSLGTNEIVHHIDFNPKNNSVENLLVIDRRIHNKLHTFLDLQRVILEKSRNENFENCWNSLITSMTTTWLETANVKVIKLWEIGQSAAEPLREKSYEEGSETMYEASETDNAVDEDIVQTTTA